MTPTRRWVIHVRRKDETLDFSWHISDADCEANHMDIPVVPAADYDALAVDISRLCDQRDALAKRVEELEGERDELARLYDTMTKSHDAVTEQLRGQRDRALAVVEAARMWKFSLSDLCRGEGPFKGEACDCEWSILHRLLAALADYDKGE